MQQKLTQCPSAEEKLSGVDPGFLGRGPPAQPFRARHERVFQGHVTSVNVFRENHLAIFAPTKTQYWSKYQRVFTIWSTIAQTLMKNEYKYKYEGV